MLLSGIRALIATQHDMLLIGEASTGKEAVQLHQKVNPDVTLMDLQMPEMNGLDAIIAITGQDPFTRVIVLTMHTRKYF